MIVKTRPGGNGRSKLVVAIFALVGGGSLFWAATVENRGFGMFQDELWNLPSAVALCGGNLGAPIMR